MTTRDPDVPLAPLWATSSSSKLVTSVGERIGSESAHDQPASLPLAMNDTPGELENRQLEGKKTTMELMGNFP